MISCTLELYLYSTRLNSKPITMNQAFNVLTQTKNGVMLVNKNDTFIGKSLIKYGEISDAENQLYLQLCNEGDVVVEAGANIGVHSLTIAKALGSSGILYCYEPQRIVFQTLNANLALNSITNTITYHSALGNSNTPLVIPELTYHDNNNFGGVSLSEKNKGEKVSQFKLDEHLHLKKINLFKIDVEGMEIETILGAKASIQKYKPILYCENDRIEKSQELIELIFSLGYKIFWHLPPLFNPNNINNIHENIFKNLVSVNMLCIPHEARIQLKNFVEVKSSSEHPMRKEQ